MKITRNDPERLIIVDFPYLVGVICIGAAIASLGHLIYIISQGDRDATHFAGHGLVIALLFFGGEKFAKRSVFDFDRARRQLQWSHTSLFGRKSGTVPFSEIKAVHLDSTSGTGSSFSYRVVLDTVNGMLPLTEAYSGGGESSFRPFCETIAQAVGLPAPGPVRDPLETLIAAGKFIEAVKVVRLQRQCSLEEAKRIVDGMRK